MKTEQEQSLAALAPMLLHVGQLRQKAGWNGYSALPPDSAAILRAEVWLRDLHRDVRNARQEWLAPHVTSSADGEVVLEWWKGPRKLTVYVSAELASFVQGWGPDIVANMAEGDASSEISRQQLWAWLTS